MDNRTHNVLIVDDDRGDYLLTSKMLARVAGTEYAPVWASSYESGIEAIRKGGFDVCLVDFRLGGKTGLDVLHAASEIDEAPPIILLTGHGDHEVDLEAMHCGAADYMVKGEIDSGSLERAIRYAVERRRAQEELDRSRREQIRLKDQFLSHVSHELSSPLAAARQFTTILLDRLVGPLTDDQEECLHDSLRNIDQLRAMIDDLLHVTRSTSGKVALEPCCMLPGPAIAEVVRSLTPAAEEQGVHLCIQSTEGLPLVFADSVRLRQILIALVNNAVKFTPAGGRVVLSARLHEPDPSMLEFEVADSGPGIPEEDREKVFDYLFQSKASDHCGRTGLGLGLFICRDLTTRHGGTIWVTPAPEGGSQFRFTIPRPNFKTQALHNDDVCTVILFRAAHKRADGVSPKLGAALRERFRSAVWKLGESAGFARGLRTWDGEKSETVVLLAGQDVDSAGPIALSIRQQLADEDSLKHSGLAIDVTAMPLRVDSTTPDARASLSARLETLLLQELSKGVDTT